MHDTPEPGEGFRTSINLHLPSRVALAHTVAMHGGDKAVAAAANGVLVRYLTGEDDFADHGLAFPLDRVVVNVVAGQEIVLSEVVGDKQMNLKVPIQMPATYAFITDALRASGLRPQRD